MFQAPQIHIYVCTNTDGASKRQCHITDGWVFGSGMQLLRYEEHYIHGKTQLVQ